MQRNSQGRGTRDGGQGNSIIQPGTRDKGRGTREQHYTARDRGQCTREQQYTARDEGQGNGQLDVEAVEGVEKWNGCLGLSLVPCP